MKQQKQHKRTSDNQKKTADYLHQKPQTDEDVESGMGSDRPFPPALQEALDDLSAATAAYEDRIAALEAAPSGPTIYHGRVSSDGIAGAVFPAGWSVVRDSLGAYTVTHNLDLGSNGYTVLAVVRDISAAYAVVEDVNADDFEVEVYDDVGDANDEDFMFIMAVG